MFDVHIFPRRVLTAGIAALSLVATASLATSPARAQNGAMSYAVPDSGAWSDILKNKAPAAKGKAHTQRKSAERKKAAPAHRQAKARPAEVTGKNDTDKNEARDAFASAPPQAARRAADVRIVSPDEFNEIDQMAAGQ